MRKSNLRSHLLETAGALFAKKGYGNVGVNEILKAGSIARASFYDHFESKDALCAAWLDSLHERSVQYHRHLLEQDKTPPAVLREYFNTLKKWLLENEFRGCPYTNTATFILEDKAGVRDAVHTHKMFIRDFFIELAGRVRPRGARRLGELLFLLYSGATIEAQNLRASWPIDRARDAALRLSRPVSEAALDLWE